jgi:hypothetical protein
VPCVLGIDLGIQIGHVRLSLMDLRPSRIVAIVDLRQHCVRFD